MRTLLHIIILTLLIGVLTSTTAEIDLQFGANRSLFNYRFCGLSGSGVAIPEAVSSATLNPALVHNWHFLKERKYSGLVGYEKDSLFEKNILSTGASAYLNDKSTVGALYRLLNSTEENRQNEVIITFAGRLFDKSLNQGAVNLGFNLRYESFKWTDPYTDSLNTLRYIYKDTLLDSILLHRYLPPNQMRVREENRFLFDLGFYQDNVVPNLHFGLVFHNLLGYTWQSHSPSVNDTIWSFIDSTTNDSIVVDSSYLMSNHDKKAEKNNKVYKRMTIGIAYQPNIAQNKVTLMVPFDLEFIGIFDRDQDLKIALHTGLEVWLLDKIIGLRFGYARGPKHITGRPGYLSMEPSNIVSGGLSFHFDHIAFDVFMQKQDFGIGTILSF